MKSNVLKIINEEKIIFEKGLSDYEIKEVERIYKIQFPESLKGFLKTQLPVSEGFYNWRNLNDENIQYIKQIIEAPFSYVKEFANEVYWCDEWGKEPESDLEMRKEVVARLNRAPKLIPVFGHRYMPMGISQNPPILSIHGLDIIYYGNNLEDYLYKEFIDSSATLVDDPNILFVPFWTEIM